MRTQIPQLGGRFLNADDVAEGRKVAFIGWKVAADLFGAEDPVGKTIVINRIPFTVVGVLQKKLQDSMYNGPDADQVYLPFHAYPPDRQPAAHQPDPHPAPRGRPVQARSRTGSATLLGRKYRFDPSRPLRHELLEHHRERQGGAGHLQGHRDLPRHHRRPDPAHRGRRRHQPDVRRGQGADQGDRHQAGHRRPAAGHRPAVLPGDASSSSPRGRSGGSSPPSTSSTSSGWPRSTTIRSASRPTCSGRSSPCRSSSPTWSSWAFSSSCRGSSRRSGRRGRIPSSRSAMNRGSP